MIDLVPLGDRAYLARFANEPEARVWASALEHQGIPGVVDVVLAYQSVGIYLDPDHPEWEAVENALRSVQTVDEPERRNAAPIVRLPVVYDGEDLEDVARRLDLTTEALIAAHSGKIYDVFAVGFLPGFPYAGYLPEALSGLRRRAIPRTRVPAGSVALAGRQTGVYPQDSPGGWHLIGRTLVPIVNVFAGYFPIRAGMRLAFDPVDAGTLAQRQDEHDEALKEAQWLSRGLAE